MTKTDDVGRPILQLDQLSIQRNAELVDEARANLQSAVDRARAGGMTWADVGLALGISRQAAWERFAAAPTPADDPGGGD